jgi:hypothetical protein
MAVSYSGTVVAMLAAPSVVDWTGPVWMVVLSGAGLFGLALFGLVQCWR